MRRTYELACANERCIAAENWYAALRRAGITEADADQASGLSAAEAEFERASDARWKAENWLLLHGTPQEQRMVLARRARDELNFTDAQLTAAGLGAAARGNDEIRLRRTRTRCGSKWAQAGARGKSENSSGRAG